MKPSNAGVWILFAALLAPATVWAKGQTVRIDITGGDLAAPLVITAADIVDKFWIWAGPGARVNGRPASTYPGAIADWPRGALASTPRGLRTYEVSFFVLYPRASHPELAYVVSYADDPATGRGYIYLPGEGEKYYDLNVSSIVHGVEGHWFYASAQWERLVRPLLLSATARADTRPQGRAASRAQSRS